MNKTIEALREQQARIIYRNNSNLNQVLEDLDVVGDITEIIINLRRK
jgi:hypothetical protein